ncbi:MAG: hypothetical protein RLY16_1322 [Bacteroidota bacterium]|jgi:hypothetical protein
MKLPIKILLINLSVAIIVSLLISLNLEDSNKVIMLGIFGLANLLIGSLMLLIGLVLLFVKNKAYAQGFLMSSGTILAIGALVCSSNYVRF